MKIMKKFKLSQTRQQLLENTIQRYNFGNRASSEGGACFYYMPETGNRCAIGVELSLKKAKGLAGTISGVGSPIVLNVLPKRLYDMGTIFLASIQNLHDIEYNWDANGLSEIGWGAVEKICKNMNDLTFPEHLK